MNVLNKLFTPKYLYWTNAAVGTVFLTGADTAEQCVQRYLAKNKSHDDAAIDLNRTKAMAGGGFLFGSMGHFWYKFLDTKFPGRSKLVIGKKLACEVAAGPPFLFIVFAFVGSLEGKTWDENVHAFKQNLLFCCLADWGFYVPLQYLNFYYLPPKYRVLFVGVITLFYDTFLSFLLHRPLQHPSTGIRGPDLAQKTSDT